MYVDEKTSLVINKEDVQTNLKETNVPNKKVSFSVTKTVILSLLTTLFYCSLQITNITVSQYVYKWLDQKYGNTTSNGENNSFLLNRTIPCPNNKNTDEVKIQQEASKWIWYFTLTEYGFPLFIILVFGVYSDFIGRKPLMLVSTIGNTIMSGLIALFMYLDLEIVYFVIAFGVGGISGARYTFMIGYLGSVADTTNRTKVRSFKIAILDILMALGRSSGQLVTGYLIKMAGYIYPIIMAFGFCFISFVLILLCIPETNRKENKSISFRQVYGNLIGVYVNKNKSKDDSKLWKLILCLSSFMIFFTPYVSRNNIETLFQLRSPFCYTSDLIGWFQFAKECIQNILGTSLIKAMHLFVKDEMIAFIGCMTGTAYFAILAFAKTSWMLYLAIAAGILATVPFPMYRGMASRMVDDDKQGALFTNIVILQIVCRLGGSTAYNNVYSVTQDVMAGLTFLIMGGTYILAGILLIPLLKSGLLAANSYKKDNSES